MEKILKRVISFTLVIAMMLSGGGQYAWAAKQDNMSIDTEKISPVKEDFRVLSDLDQKEKKLYLSVNEEESFSEKGLCIENIYALVSEESGGTVLETYRLGYKENGEYYLETETDNVEMTTLYMQPVVVYAFADDNKNTEQEVSECSIVENDVLTNHDDIEILELDEVVYEFELLETGMDQGDTSAVEDIPVTEETEVKDNTEEVSGPEEEIGYTEITEEETKDAEADQKTDNPETAITESIETENKEYVGSIEDTEDIKDIEDTDNADNTDPIENGQEDAADTAKPESEPEFLEADGEAYAAERAAAPSRNSISVSNPDGKQKEYQIAVTCVGYSDVQIAVWSENNGQDDLIWYPAKKSGDAYTVNVQMKNHSSSGTYIAHTYGKDQDGASKYITGVRFTVNAPTVGKVAAEKSDTGFRVKLSGVTCPSGIERIEAGIWCNSNQSDLVWKNVEKKNGEYVLDVDAVEHRMLAGTYYVHFYAVDGNEFRNYCGGIAQKVEFEQNKLMIQNPDQQQKKYKVTLNTVEYTNVKFAVWSENNGQDDLKWYTGENKGSFYTTEIDIKAHGSTGRYYVHVYGYKGGKAYYINGSGFTVNAPTAGKFSAKRTDAGFQVSFDGVSSPSGISKVEAGVWCSGDQSDLTWHTLTPNNGKYVLDVKIADHKMLMGTYIVHVYAVDGNGIRNYCGGIRQNVSVTAQSMKATVSETACEIAISGVSYGNGSSILIGVWSKNNGQDDLAWYDAKQSGNDYKVSIPMDKLKDTGTYYAHAYAIDSSGRRVFVSGITFSIDCKISIGDAKNGEILVEVSRVDADKKYTECFAEVWTKENQSDLQTIHSVKTSGDGYTIKIPLSKFGLYSGDYHIRVYGNKGNGNKDLLKEGIKAVKIEKGTVAAPSVSSNKMTYTITLNNVDLKGMEKNIRFAVWSDTNGQDDLVWYTAAKSGNSYKVNVPIYNHKDTGKYFVHIYATLQDGTSLYLNGRTFQVDKIVQSSVEVKNVSGSRGTAQIVTQFGNLGYDVKGVRVGVWNVDTNGKVVWYDMAASSDQYIATFDIKKHDFQFGKYNAHVYAADASGVYKYLNGTSFTISSNNTVMYQKVDGTNGKVTIYGANVNGTPVTSIKMATWSNAGNQDDLKWTEAKKDSTGGYYVNIIRDDYKRSGEFTTHVYAYINGQSYCIAGITYTVYKTGEFDEYAQGVMHNIIFAVETGGQVYGKAQYDCFAPAYNLTAKETAITIGAGGWFATEAKKLLKLTREEDPVLFASLDTEGISYDIDNANWNTYGSDGNGKATILRGSDKAKCIQKLISTPAGIKVQNHLVDVEMIRYVKEAKNLGVTDLKGQMFLANIRHLGGYSPMKRVVEWCQEDNLSLTMKNLYTSMRNHTTNKAGNGVGADKYNTRHVKVMGWLDKYIV